MILRVDTLHESYRLFLYSPFWIVNRTELQLELQVKNFVFSIIYSLFILNRLKIIVHLLK
jgi:hypothetical protein